MLERWTIAIPRYLHQSKGAVVAGWKSALFIPLAITATETGVLSQGDEPSDCRKKIFDSHLGPPIFHLIIRIGFFARFDTSQTCAPLCSELTDY